MKTKNKILSLFILFAVLLQTLSIIPQSYVAETSGDYTYTVEVDDTVTITEYKGKDKVVSIPSIIGGYKVTTLDSGVFSDNSTLEELTIAGNVVFINSGAIYGCTKLKKLTIGSSVRVVQSLAVDACNKLSTLTVKNGVKVFEGNAVNSNSLKSVSLPNSVNRVGSQFMGYFYDEDEEKSTKISGFTITGYTGSAVESYASENKFTFKSAGKYKEDKDNNFLYYKSEEGVYIYKYLGVGGAVKIPEKIENSSVYEVDAETFNEYSFMDVMGKYGKDLKYITSIEFPSGCTLMSADQIVGCQKLKSVKLPKGISEIDEKALGYFYDLDKDKYTKISGFKIIGYSSTAAETYAKENGFTFSSLGDVKDEDETNTSETINFVTQTKPSSESEDTSNINTEPSTNYTFETYISFPDEDETQMQKPTYTLPTMPKKSVSVVSVDSVKLNKTSVVICTSQKLFLNAVVSPQNATNSNLKWTSSNTKIASVSAQGVVTGIKNGDVNITAAAKDGSGKKAVCKIKVVQGVQKISLDRSLADVTNDKNKSFTLKATIAPNNVKNNKVKWSSSNKKTAVVDSKGKVTVTAEGSAVITCKTTDGSEKFAECIVINGTKTKSISFDSKSITLKVGTNTKLKANVSGGVCDKVKWSTNNKKIVTVNSDGKIYGKKTGKAVITAKAADGSKKTAKCTVSVKCHNYGNWTTVSKANCIHDGLQIKICKGCGNTLSRIIKNGQHDWEKHYILDEEPLCEESGSASIHCKYCNSRKDSKTIPALGHYYSITNVTEEPSCTEEGKAVKRCYTCSMEIVTVIPPKGHRWADEKTVDKQPTCVCTGEKSLHCLDCDAKKDVESIPKTSHHITKYITTKRATMTSDGKKIGVCYNCDTLKSVKIDKISSVKLKTKTYIYDASPKNPEVIVKDSNNKKLVLNTDYEIKYQNGRTNVNEYSVKIVFKNNYQGTNTQKFKIIPKTTKITSLKLNSGNLTVNWKVQKEKTDGYLLQYGLKSDLSDKKNISIDNNKTSSKIIEKLKTDKTYYFAIRTYKKVKINGKSQKIYSNRSQIKKIAVK